MRTRAWGGARSAHVVQSPAEGSPELSGALAGFVKERVSPREAVRALGFGLGSFAQLRMVGIVVLIGQQQDNIASQDEPQRRWRGRSAFQSVGKLDVESGHCVVRRRPDHGPDVAPRA